VKQPALANTHITTSSYTHLHPYSPADIDDSAPDLNGFTAKSPQYKWLEKKLKKVDRSKTPWVVVVWQVAA
jgi:hypothetical protein